MGVRSAIGAYYPRVYARRLLCSREFETGVGSKLQLFIRCRMRSSLTLRPSSGWAGIFLLRFSLRTHPRAPPIFVCVDGAREPPFTWSGYRHPCVERSTRCCRMLRTRKCIRACLKGSSEYALFDGQTVLQLSDPEGHTAKFAAHGSRLRGTLDQKTKTD